MTTPNPNVDYTKEIRFAVVMYGGVSLAIYINGVAQELLQMVRATAADDKKEKARFGWEELSGSEKVYRKLSHLLAADANADSADADAASAHAGADSTIETKPIPIRFVVDTITGASAGGINGIFLAKALVRGQQLDSLQELWVREGAIEKLLNDRLSVDPPAVTFDNPPTALLNAKRMYFELLKAFDGMDGVKAGDLEGKPSQSLVDELDLFVTTTDLHGAILPIRLSDEVVFERRHKNVFHFLFPRDDDDRSEGDSDFAPKTNPFLAYAARCTSSFPFAFEPMTLTDIDPILDGYDVYEDEAELRSNNKSWQRFFRDYEQAAGIKHVPPSRRAFADGGDLDNKPFGYAVDTLTKRHADYPIARKLLYVEPAPDHPEFQTEKDKKPNVVENALDALSTLPMYETIREDLKRVSDRNRLVVRINRVLENVDLDVKKAKTSDGTENVQQTIDRNHDDLAKRTDESWSGLYLDDMIRRKGRGYVGYHRLEIAAVTDDLARLVTRGFGLSEDSDYFAVNRSLARAWRGLRYVDHRGDAETEAGNPATHPPHPINQFLTNFNLAYPIRRIAFLRNRIEALLCLDENKLKETYEDFELTSEWVSQFRDELRQIYRSLKDPEAEIRKAGRSLSSRPKHDAVKDKEKTQHDNLSELRKLLIEACAAKLEKDRKGELVVRKKDGTLDPIIVLNYFLRGAKHTVCDSPEAQIDGRAKDLLEDPAGKDVLAKMNEVTAVIAEQVREARTKADHECRNTLRFKPDRESGANKGDDPRRIARACLQNYYQNYDDYDMIIFPITYETEVGEPALVDVFRVSPEDANALIDERTTKCRKLAGTALAHFGAFLQKRWRENDILWGRLDGAERIIASLLPADHPQKEKLIAEAQAAIVYETIKGMGVNESRNLICEALMRTASGEAEPSLLTSGDDRRPGFVDKLATSIGELNIKPHDAARAKLAEKIDRIGLRDHYCEIFPIHSRPEPESTARTAARATTIVGKIFENLADDQVRAGKKYAGWITRIGLVGWGMVELATPRSLWNLLIRHWLKILYALEVVMIVGATILAKPEVSQFGWTLFGITAAVNAIVWSIHDYMIYQQRVVRLLLTLLVLAILTLALVGALKTGSVLFEWTVKGLSPLGWVHVQVDRFASWMTAHLPARIWTAIKIITPVAVALAVLRLLWFMGRVKNSGPRTEKEE